MNALTIADTAIRQDAEGRYCLNDLHRAAGGEKRHQPSDWLRLKQTQELIAELAVPGIPGTLKNQPLAVIQGGTQQGTYVAKELVYAYAMWISAAFHLKVIRAYDALVAQPAAPAIPQTLPEALRLAADLAEQKAKAEAALAIAAPKVEGFDRIANATGLLSLRETATTLKVPERKFITWMQRHDWLYRRPGKGTLLGYAERLKEGYLEHKAVTIHNDRTGEDEIREQVRVTPLGLTVLAKRAKDMQEVAHG